MACEGHVRGEENASDWAVVVYVDAEVGIAFSVIGGAVAFDEKRLLVIKVDLLWSIVECKYIAPFKGLKIPRKSGRLLCSRRNSLGIVRLNRRGSLKSFLFIGRLGFILGMISNFS